MARAGYAPYKTLYNRFIRWSRLCVFDRIFAAHAGEGPQPERIMIDATLLKAHRTAASLLKRGRNKICLKSYAKLERTVNLRPLPS